MSVVSAIAMAAGCDCIINCGPWVQNHGGMGSRIPMLLHQVSGGCNWWGGIACQIPVSTEGPGIRNYPKCRWETGSSLTSVADTTYLRCRFGVLKCARRPGSARCDALVRTQGQTKENMCFEKEVSMRMENLVIKSIAKLIILITILNFLKMKIY